MIGPNALLTRIATIEETMLAVFFRAAAFERQTGFIERATAAYQAMIEYNCFRPKIVCKYFKKVC